MKITLINPPFAKYGGVSGHGGKSLPLNLAYLAAYLRKFRPQDKISVLDAEGLGLSYEQIKKKVEKDVPDIAAITTPTPAYSKVLEVCNRIKEIDKGIIIVTGGPHPSAFPREILLGDCFDISVMGEGEVTFCELVEALDRGRSLEGVKGIAFKKNSEIIINQRRELIQDLDSIPFPARDLFPTDIYFPPPTKRVSNTKAGNMITSRGCPYDCIYCESKVIWSRIPRMRSPMNVADEIEECVRKYDIREFNFHDDILPMKKERTVEICNEIVKRNLKISWVCMARVNFIWEDVLIKMKEAGCKKIVFGFESGSQTILDIMNKRSTIDQAVEAVKLCKKIGIKAAGNFMIGNIGETRQTIRESIDFAKALKPDTVAFFTTVPYPGTDLYKIAKSKGYIRDDVTWHDFTPISHGKPTMNLPGLSYKELERLKKRAYREFYLRPRYILSKLREINSIQGIRNILYAIRIFRKVG